MRRVRRAAIPLAVLVLAAAGVASGAVADRAGMTFGLMADEFIRAFQPVEGLVVEAQGDRLYLDVVGPGVQVGQEFTVFRKGDVFSHPLTGRALGRYEEVLGHAQVLRVLPRFSEAVFHPTPGAPPPGPEDGVRITRGRIPVAVTPVLDLTGADGDLRRVPYLIAVTLERSKRFQVVDPLAVTDMLASTSTRIEEVLALPDRAARAARQLEVTGWLVPVLLQRHGVTYLDVTWVSAVTGTALFSRRLPLVPATSLEGQRFPWEPRVQD